ncbi:Septum formation protein Maf [Dissulfuribacter thermophilus]|uniref:dTTP/UTP pyrophosphatase n=1 Tax=Dissulfuribacter thermophilus TaxID=1156395 RepID=A0A1B9F7C9_9BACT|nr:Maf family protein [Dissulfuribacter thermophilus]OCC15793.1 Septum formation protein Maf [Dissulfuribacter thermophilus]
MVQRECKGPLQTLERLILASKSPRRRDLLSGLGLKFDVIPSEEKEPPFQEGQLPQEYALHVAKLKARNIAKNYKDSWVLGADTIVVVDGDVLGKPKDREQALSMLTRLTGRMHTVYTGCWIVGPYTSGGYEEGFVVGSNVWLSNLSRDILESYVLTGEPMDKAGSYAVQGLGSFMVERIEGSYTNVVGLPLTELVGTLLKLEIVGPRK